MSDTASVTRRVFVCSTVYDLAHERQLVRATLGCQSNDVRFEVVTSEDPAFPVTPSGLRDKHSYQICLDALASVDYVVLLVRNRYGRANIEHNGERVSITHMEYRTAFEQRLPVFTFVDHRTWAARHLVRTGEPQGFIPAKELRVLELLDEILHQPRGNWMYFFTSDSDLQSSLSQLMLSYDDSQFVDDVTVPDGMVIRTRSRIEKQWAIRNAGNVTWRNRYLRQENAQASRLVADEELVPIERTRPGQIARITVRLTAPAYPGTCESYWKMVDQEGRYCFPHKKGLFCRVKVVY